MRLALPFVFSMAAFAQLNPLTLVGTIERIGAGELRIKDVTRSVTLATDERTEVIKGGGRVSVSRLLPGSEVSVRYVTGGQKPIATKIWADAITFSAVIKYVNAGAFEVAVNQSGERRIVAYYPGTAFGASLKDLTVGQQVRIAGIDLQNGTVDAIRVTIYNTDMPVDRFAPKQK